MATAASVHLACDDVGGADPAVVLLHALFENRTYYAAQVQHLTGRHRVLNIDLRGHGESDVPEQGYTMDVLVDDVLRVCAEAGVTRAVFCGHSFPVALRVAVRRPDLAAGVVLLDGVVVVPEDQRKAQAGLARVLETDGWRDALLGFFGGEIAAGAGERVRADIATVPKVYAAPLMRDIASSDSAEELSALRCPLLYIHGVMPADLARLRELRPDAVIESIPNAGHYLMLTAPDEVNAALDRFLERLR